MIYKMEKKKTLVIGASTNPERYSYLAVQRLTANQHPVVALGLKKGSIENTEIETERKPFEQIDTVTLYVNPLHQKDYYNYILSLQPKRIIFNPGTENDELVEMAHQKGIETMDACTLVLLSTGQY
jgi:predicted CoA-binding protein